MNAINPIVSVDVSILLQLPIHREAMFKEVDPKTKLFCEVHIKRVSKRRATLRLRDWPGPVFHLEVDLVRAVAQLTLRHTMTHPGSGHLTAGVFRTCMRMLTHREFD